MEKLLSKEEIENYRKEWGVPSAFAHEVFDQALACLELAKENERLKKEIDFLKGVQVK